MRVTQSMITNNSLRNLSTSYARLGKYQDQLSTGKKINRPSDDPVVAIKGMFYRTNLTEVEQYKRNLSEVYTWIENSEAGIEHATQVLQRARELLVQGKNGTNSNDDREAIAREIEQLKRDLVQIANTQVAGRYIFNGTNIHDAPIVDGNPPVYSTNHNNDDFLIEVSQGVRLKVNINPNNVFSEELFRTMQGIQDKLDGINPALDFDTLLNELDQHMDKMLAERSELGARYNRVELIEARINQQQVIASRILSDNEDADIERVITDLKTQESVHRAALGVGARIIQPTLIDFLR